MIDEPIVLGMLVLKHQTVDKFGELPQFKIAFRSADKKTTMSLVLPDVGRHIFSMFPTGEVIELHLVKPSQTTLDAFEEADEENTNDETT